MDHKDKLITKPTIVDDIEIQDVLTSFDDTNVVANKLNTFNEQEIVLTCDLISGYALSRNDDKEHKTNTNEALEG